MDQEPVKDASDFLLKERKEVEWRNILSAIFLLMSPFVGLILMWVLASWSKKMKVIITVVFILPFIITLGFSIFLDPRPFEIQEYLFFLIRAIIPREFGLH